MLQFDVYLKCYFMVPTNLKWNKTHLDSPLYISFNHFYSKLAYLLL